MGKWKRDIGELRMDAQDMMEEVEKAQGFWNEMNHCIHGVSQSVLCPMCEKDWETQSFKREVIYNE